MSIVLIRSFIWEIYCILWHCATDLDTFWHYRGIRKTKQLFFWYLYLLTVESSSVQWSSWANNESCNENGNQDNWDASSKKERTSLGTFICFLSSWALFIDESKGILHIEFIISFALGLRLWFLRTFLPIWWATHCSHSCCRAVAGFVVINTRRSLAHCSRSLHLLQTHKN